MPENRHKYLYERPGDHDFQQLVVASTAKPKTETFDKLNAKLDGHGLQLTSIRLWQCEIDVASHGGAACNACAGPPAAQEPLGSAKTI